MSDPASDTPSRPTIVKICGITRPADGLCALQAGADWLGFIRWPPSSRFIGQAACREVLEAIRQSSSRPFQAVGVYVDATAAEIETDAAAIGLDRVQLHGEETPEMARGLPLPVIKALRIRDAGTLRLADRYEAMDLLADTYDPALPGGTGRTWDYGMLRDLVRRRHVIVAGGLTAINVAEVVRTLRPFGVDVSSAVEATPGVKDHDKIRAFMRAVRESG